MKLVRATGFALLLSTGFLTGCDNDGTGPSSDRFVGSWSATSFSYTDASNPALSLDIITHLGGTLAITVAQDLSFTGTLNIPNVTPVALPIGGDISLNAAGDSVTVVWNATTASYTTPDTENCPGGRLLDDFTASFSFNETETILTITETDADFDFPDQIDPRCAVPAVAVVRLAKS